MCFRSPISRLDSPNTLKIAMLTIALAENRYYNASVKTLH